MPSPSLFLLFACLAWASQAANTAADNRPQEGCAASTVCGKVTISSPFAVVPEQATESKCGWLGFQVICRNDTPYLGYYKLGYRIQVLDIFYGNNSLLVSDIHKLGDFDVFSGVSKEYPCHVPTSNTSSKVALPFSISTTNLNLFLYNCNKTLVPRDGDDDLVETRCGNKTFARVGGNYSVSGDYAAFYMEGCNATVVPVMGTDAGSYEQLIRDGFLLTWQGPPSSACFLKLPAPASSSNSSSPGCLPTPCGNLTISYPFWLEEPGRPPCGSPPFQLKCNASGAYLTHTIYEAYRVVDIFTGNNTVHVVDENLPLATGCPAPPFNISDGIWQAPFVISEANAELRFLSCNKSLPAAAAPPGFHRLPCDDQNSSVRLVSDHLHEDGIPPGCNFTVVPIVQRHNGSMAGYIASMRSGFLLEWAVVSGDCPKCQVSGGNCTYSDDLEFACNCPDGMHPDKCREFRKSEEHACGSGGGILLIVSIFIFAWHKRKKRKQTRDLKDLMHSSSSMQSYSKDLELGGSPHIFTYEELEEATAGFSASRELGDGGFGTVYKGKLRDGRVVAVKRLYKNNYRRVEQFLNEVDILSRLLHQNLVILYGCTSRSSRDLLLVYEYIPNGTVADHLHGPRAGERGLTWPVRMTIAIETAEALAYLHAVEIIHRDVKTNNILLDNNFHVKVADFGLSRLFPLEVTHVSTVPQGTPGYVDPVYHQCYKLTDKSDVYSFGVVLIELISSKPAVDMSRSHSDINLANMALNRIQNHEVDQLVDPEIGYETDSETKRMVDLVAELAFQCLQMDRDSRPPIKEVVEVLNCIKNGECPAEKMNKNASPKEDSHLLKDNLQYSPDSVIHRFHSQSTNHSVASNSSG
uniref:non-specific serine/threonine protein kinase n=1 Tax=Oryza barthii TaxID=65489 RepID=A0A0D3EJC2_9ORYZ